MEDDSREYRALRFEMLADTPLAYLETLEQARMHPDSHWRGRAANTSAASRLFAAVAADGRWIGSIGGFQASGAPHPYLVGVYVTPAYRGREHRVTDELLDAVSAWARSRSDRLLLQVHEQNHTCDPQLPPARIRRDRSHRALPARHHRARDRDGARG